MFPASISALIERILLETTPLPGDLPAETARRHGAIPLMGDLGGAWLLRPDGSLWEVAWDTDSENSPRPLRSERRIIALAVGARRYPWLSALLPTPPPDAQPCAACRGEGEIRISPNRMAGGVICGECQALGWRA